MRRSLSEAAASIAALSLLVLSACTPRGPSYGAAPPDLVTMAPNATATATPFQPGPPSDTDVLNILVTQMAAATQTALAAPTETSTPEPPSPTPTETLTAAPTLPPATSVPAGSRTL